MTQDASRVNDFALKIATVNGTGSASANGLLMQSIFRMGIPVSGKNLFPSNIQGLPTWYEIRVSGEGWTARTERFDLFVAMNPATYARDAAEVASGGWLLYDATRPLDRSLQRGDVTHLGIPLAALCNERYGGARERILMKNIAYVGALTELLGIEADVVETLLNETYGRKKALLDSNHEAVQLGRDYAREHFACPLPIRLERMDGNRDHVVIDGNTAAALGCLWAGATVAAWYPITPSTSLVEAFSNFCRKYRHDPDSGRARYAVLQAEDELAAAGMVIGANWAGARAFTATSGAGISLMSEFIGLAYYAEIPSVFFDIQRVGPSTGMPTRTQQGDLLTVAYASHGDTKHLVLFPADPRECFELARTAFDLAERFQTPVFVLSDLDIAMNDWVVPKLSWDDAYRPDRGKVLGPAELETIQQFYRYLDSDGDGIPYRTIPGEHPRGAYFTRGSGHDRFGRYTEDAAAYTDVLDRLLVKLATAAEAVPAPELVPAGEEPAPLGLITIGGCRAAVLEAQARLAEAGVATDVMRIRAFPFGQAVRAFLDAHERCVVVEQNRDAQLRTLLINEAGARPERLASSLRYGGLPLSADSVVGDVLAALGRADAAGAAAAAPAAAGRGDGAPAGGVAAVALDSQQKASRARGAEVEAR